MLQRQPIESGDTCGVECQPTGSSNERVPPPPPLRPLHCRPCSLSHQQKQNGELLETAYAPKAERITKAPSVGTTMRAVRGALRRLRRCPRKQEVRHEKKNESQTKVSIPPSALIRLARLSYVLGMLSRFPRRWCASRTTLRQPGATERARNNINNTGASFTLTWGGA